MKNCTNGPSILRLSLVQSTIGLLTVRPSNYPNSPPKEQTYFFSRSPLDGERQTPVVPVLPASFLEHGMGQQIDCFVAPDELYYTYYPHCISSVFYGERKRSPYARPATTATTATTGATASPVYSVSATTAIIPTAVSASNASTTATTKEATQACMGRHCYRVLSACPACPASCPSPFGRPLIVRH